MIQGKTEERIKWRERSKSRRGGGGKRNFRLVRTVKTSVELAEWRRFQRKNLYKMK